MDICIQKNYSCTMEKSIYPFPSNDRVVGASVIDLRCGIEELSKHNVDCCSRCSIAREVRKMSLASTLELVCDTCEKYQIIPQISSSAEINQRYSVKVGAVWGQLMSIGGGGAEKKRLLMRHWPH